MIIDGKNAVLGRLASKTAKDLLDGHAVEIINAEKIIITGNPQQIVNDYLEKRRKGGPHHGPFFPKKPDLIVRRVIRSMLPYKTNKGRKAFRNLKVYINVPASLQDKEAATLTKRVKTDFLRIGDLSKAMGWKE